MEIVTMANDSRDQAAVKLLNLKLSKRLKPK